MNFFWSFYYKSVIVAPAEIFLDTTLYSLLQHLNF